MKKRVYYYCDMDGVLADFFSEPNAVARFENEPQFFANLKPIQNNVNAINKLIENGASVRILSASPNAQADNDKREWLAKYLPNLKKRNIIIMRNGQNKADFMQTKNGVLFDDWGKNGRDWEAKTSANVYCAISEATTIAYWLKTIWAN